MLPECSGLRLHKLHLNSHYLFETLRLTQLFHKHVLAAYIAKLPELLRCIHRRPAHSPQLPP